MSAPHSCTLECKEGYRAQTFTVTCGQGADKGAAMSATNPSGARRSLRSGGDPNAASPANCGKRAVATRHGRRGEEV